MFVFSLNFSNDTTTWPDARCAVWWTKNKRDAMDNVDVKTSRCSDAQWQRRQGGNWFRRENVLSFCAKFIKSVDRIFKDRRRKKARWNPLPTNPAHEVKGNFIFPTRNKPWKVLFKLNYLKFKHTFSLLF